MPPRPVLLLLCAVTQAMWYVHVSRLHPPRLSVSLTRVVTVRSVRCYCHLMMFAMLMDDVGRLQMSSHAILARRALLGELGGICPTVVHCIWSVHGQPHELVSACVRPDYMRSSRRHTLARHTQALPPARPRVIMLQHRGAGPSARPAPSLDVSQDARKRLVVVCFTLPANLQDAAKT